MIIGINGKIGSGKDTVGSIVQYLTANDKSEDCIKRIRGGLPISGYHDSSFEIMKFAGKLKQIASILTGIPVYDFENQDFKKTLLGEEWGTVKPHPMNNIPAFENVNFNQLMSVREFLQKLGTEAMRDSLHTNVWVNALFADYKPSIYSDRGGWEYPNWIITDMRFPNEMEAVVERKGITIRVVRPEIKEYFQLKKRNGSITHATLHPSETSLDKAEFKYTILNDGSIDDLVEKVREILTKENII